MVSYGIQKKGRPKGSKTQGETRISFLRKWIAEGNDKVNVAKLYRAKYGRDFVESNYWLAKKQVRASIGNSSSDSISPQSPSVISSPVDTQAILGEAQGKTIEGKTYSPEIAEAPIQTEGSEIARNYQANPQPESTPEVLTPEAEKSRILEVTNPNPQVSEIPQVEQALDLSMFASLPAIAEESIFLLPQIQKMTDGYKVEQEDLDNITKYTTQLIQKYDTAGFISKYAPEFNFIGALAVPWLKGFGRKIADMMSKIGQKKEKKQDKKAELHKEPGLQESKPKTIEDMRARAQEIVRENEHDKRIREQQEYEAKIKEANLTPTSDNPSPSLEDLK